MTVPTNQVIVIANVDHPPPHDAQPRASSATSESGNISDAGSTRSPASAIALASDIEPKAEAERNLSSHHELLISSDLQSSTSDIDAFSKSSDKPGVDRDVRSLAQMAGATSLKGPEFNYAITYVNKIKVG